MILIKLVIVAQNQPDDLEIMRKMAKDQGYDSKEKILELIKQKINGQIKS
jgi:hypothetical protein